MTRILENMQPFALLVLRAVLGLVMAVHGWIITPFPIKKAVARFSQATAVKPTDGVPNGLLLNVEF